MALVLNEEQMMLRDSAAGFLSEKAGVAQLRDLREQLTQAMRSGDTETASELQARLLQLMRRDRPRPRRVRRLNQFGGDAGL